MKNAEAAARLGDLGALLPEGLLLVDCAGRVHDANPAALRLLAGEGGPLEGRNLAALVATPRDELASFLERCSGSGQMELGRLRTLGPLGRSLRCEGRLFQRGRRGAPAVVLLRVHPRDPTGGRFGLLSQKLDELGREVLRRRRAESLVDAQRTGLELVATGAPLEEILGGLARSVERHSGDEALASILLLDAEDRLRDGAGPSLPDAYRRAIDGVAAGPDVGSCGTAAHENRTVVVRDIASDPLWRDFRDLALSHGLRACWSTPIRALAGEVIGVFAIYYREPRDPTPSDQRIVAITTRTAAVAIERRRLDERISQLLVSEQEARAEAEAADRAKDEFLALVSHELRNPLHAIVGWTRLLRSPELDAETRERALQTVERNVELQAQLIGDLLDFSRISTGKFEIETRPLDLAALVRDGVDSLRPEAERRELTLELRADDPVPVAGDPDRLLQVLTNLVSNALKFTPAGGSVRVSVARRGELAELRVADTGCGLTPEELPRVFDRFVQLGAAGSRGGLGLGLSVVRHIAELHGGSVDVQSDGPGKGATFTVRLRARGALGPRPVEPSSAREPESLAELRVLLVEDDPDAREVMETALRLHGAAVRGAGSAEEALECLREGLPDVLVSDLGLPDRSGFSLVQELHRVARGRRVGAVAVSAYARERDRQRALEAGFDLHLAKPVEPSELRGAIALLASRGAGSAPGAADGGPARRVVVIDDHRDAADSLALLLRRAGLEVHVAYAGRAGVALALQVGADAVVSDVRLPDLDGLEVARRLRREGGPELTLVALTGSADMGIEDAALEAGFDRLLAKPADGRALALALGGSL